MRVVRLMRERGLGNSATQLSKKLREQHTESWMQRSVQYLCAAEPFTSGLTARPDFKTLPPQPPLPKPHWFRTVYAQDILLRMDDIKARLTSTYGSVLKMDSTKKVNIVG